MESWILSRRDALNTARPAQPAPSGIRLFLQCMEIKKEGPSSLNETQCHQIASRLRESPLVGAQ